MTRWQLQYKRLKELLIILVQTISLHTSAFMSSSTSERAQKLAELRARFPEADVDVIDDALTLSHHNVLAAVNMLTGFGCKPAHSGHIPARPLQPPPFAAPPPVAVPVASHPPRASVFNDFKSGYVERALAQSKGNEVAALEVTCARLRRI